MSEATKADFKDDVYNKNDEEMSTTSDDTENSTENSTENDEELFDEFGVNIKAKNELKELYPDWNDEKIIEVASDPALYFAYCNSDGEKKEEKMAETLNKVDKLLTEQVKEELKDLKDLKDLVKDMPFFVPTGIYTPINKMTMDVFKQTLGEKVVKDLNNYEKYHQNKANKQIHYMALLNNIFYTMALLSVFNTTFIKVDFIVFLFYILYYKLYGSDYCAVFMGGFLGNIYVSSKIYTLMLPNHFWYSLVMLSSSWFLQFYGHIIYEKNSPALTTSLSQSFTIAPVHLAVESVEKMGGVMAIIDGFIEGQIFWSKKIDMVLTWYRNRNISKNKKD